jgi:transcription initiation factor TFIIE subunit alpha
LGADYDQYYASLAASSAPSSQDTPSGLGVPAGSDFGDFDNEEEDRKPSVQYLDSLNDYRKRSRSMEDEGRSPGKKTARVSELSSYYGNPNGLSPNVLVELAVSGGAEDPGLEDDPMVYGTCPPRHLFNRDSECGVK